MLERLEHQKKLTANQWRIILTTNLGDMLDFFDFFLIGYILAFILKEWHITYGQSAIILISAGLGAVPAPSSGAGWATASAAARCLC